MWPRRAACHWIESPGVSGDMVIGGWRATEGWYSPSHPWPLCLLPCCSPTSSAASIAVAAGWYSQHCPQVRPSAVATTCPIPVPELKLELPPWDKVRDSSSSSCSSLRHVAGATCTTCIGPEPPQGLEPPHSQSWIQPARSPTAQIQPRAQSKFDTHSVAISQ